MGCWGDGEKKNAENNSYKADTEHGHGHDKSVRLDSEKV